MAKRDDVVSKDIIEQFAIEKAQATQIAHARLGVVGAFTLAHGELQDDGSVTYRLPKTALDAVTGHHVNLEPAGKGGMKITVRKVE